MHSNLARGATTSRCGPALTFSDFADDTPTSSSISSSLVEPQPEEAAEPEVRFRRPVDDRSVAGDMLPVHEIETVIKTVDFIFILYIIKVK